MSEALKPSETVTNLPAKNQGVFARLDDAQINSLITSRKQGLESIKSQISRKLCFGIEEKIAGEENHLKQILDWQQGKHNQLSKYSLILDSHYFEQEFLN